MASAWLLRRRGLSLVLPVAFLALGSRMSSLARSGPHVAGICLLSNWRVALLGGVGCIPRAACAGLISGRAWPARRLALRHRRMGGSAMGIGMAQNLGYIPPLFVLAAGAVVLCRAVLDVLPPHRELLLRGDSSRCALCVFHQARMGVVARSHRWSAAGGFISPKAASTAIRNTCARTRGRLDVGAGGEACRSFACQRPPLIGNRRQGPDLAEVGGRRSPMWLKAHFFNPAEVSGASIMPSYAFLFNDQRGNDLVAYLESLHGAGTQQHISAEEKWQPSFSAVADSNYAAGKRLYDRYCASCHSQSEAVRNRWRSSFKRLPPDFTSGPYSHLPPPEMAEERFDRIAQIAKFGIPGTDMPGHEYLPDTDIASIGRWLSQNIAQSGITKSNSIHTGEER